MLRALMGPKSVHLAVAALIASALLVGAAPAVANNDPHRVFSPSPPFDIPPGVCTFGVHVEAPVDKEYSTVTTEPDGSTIVKTTGALVQTLTNQTTGKSITLNASGPLTVTIPPPPSTVVTADVRGLSIVFVTNGAEFGLPNLMYVSGPFGFTTDLSNDTLVSVTRSPHVRLDICAALS
jgi:hypothetical protein